MVWPWIEAELAKIWDLRHRPDAPRDAGITAVAFLRMLIALRQVLLQDAAAMLALIPSRRDHCFFRHPLFMSAEFVAFSTQMEDALRNATSHDTEKASIDSILPGINSRFDRLDDENKSQKETLHAILGHINDMRSSSSQFESDVRQAATLLAGGTPTNMNNPPTGTTTLEHSEVANGDPNADLEQAQRYVLIENFQSVQQMVDCWFGRGSHKNIPIQGGICECERRWKTKWRKHWDVNTDQKKLSRMRAVVLAVDGNSDRLEQLEVFWHKTQSLYGLVKECESLGYRSAPARKKCGN